MENNTYQPNILILAEPSSGKTYSLKFIREELASSSLYINGDNKRLPWVGPQHFKRVTLDCPTELPGILQMASEREDIKYVFIDTLTRVMSDYIPRFISVRDPKCAYDKDGNMITNLNYVTTHDKNGLWDRWDAWDKYGALFSDILSIADKGNFQAVFMAHLESSSTPAGYKFKAPFKASPKAIGLEGFFTIIMLAKSIKLETIKDERHEFLTHKESKRLTKSKYVFQVEHNEETLDAWTIRCIDGVWPEDVTHVDNDLQMILDHISSVLTD